MSILGPTIDKSNRKFESFHSILCCLTHLFLPPDSPVLMLRGIMGHNRIQLQGHIIIRIFTVIKLVKFNGDEPFNILRIILNNYVSTLVKTTIAFLYNINLHLKVSTNPCVTDTDIFPFFLEKTWNKISEDMEQNQ